MTQQLGDAEHASISLYGYCCVLYKSNNNLSVFAKDLVLLLPHSPLFATPSSIQFYSSNLCRSQQTARTTPTLHPPKLNSQNASRTSCGEYSGTALRSPSCRPRRPRLRRRRVPNPKATTPAKIRQNACGNKRQGRCRRVPRCKHTIARSAAPSTRPWC